MDFIKNINFKELKNIIALAAFALLFIAGALVSALVFKQPVGWMCLIMIIEVGIAACLNNAELWLHCVVVLIQLIVCILVPRIPQVIICVIIYVAAVAALRVLSGNGKNK